MYDRDFYIDITRSDFENLIRVNRMFNFKNIAKMVDEEGIINLEKLNKSGIVKDKKSLIIKLNDEKEVNKSYIDTVRRKDTERKTDVNDVKLNITINNEINYKIDNDVNNENKEKLNDNKKNQNQINLDDS